MSPSPARPLASSVWPVWEGGRSGCSHCTFGLLTLECLLQEQLLPFCPAPKSAPAQTVPSSRPLGHLYPAVQNRLFHDKSQAPAVTAAEVTSSFSATHITVPLLPAELGWPGSPQTQGPQEVPGAPRVPGVHPEPTAPPASHHRWPSQPGRSLSARPPAVPPPQGHQLPEGLFTTRGLAQRCATPAIPVVTRRDPYREPSFVTRFQPRILHR